MKFLHRNAQSRPPQGQGGCVDKDAQFRADFARRFNEVLDAAGVPRKGRQANVGKTLRVSQKGSRKWLKGIALPELWRIAEIAATYNTTESYLLWGKATEVDVNLERISRLIIVLEQLLVENHKVIRPEDKGPTVVLIYEWLRRTGKEPDRAVIQPFLRLVA